MAWNLSRRKQTPYARNLESPPHDPIDFRKWYCLAKNLSPKGLIADLYNTADIQKRLRARLANARPRLFTSAPAVLFSCSTDGAPRRSSRLYGDELEFHVPVPSTPLNPDR